MNERFYLLTIGIYVLVSLYLEIDMMIYALSVFLIFEGVTNIRITTSLQKIRNVTLDSGLVAFQTKKRFDFDGLRAWRIIVASVLIISYLMLHELGFQFLWFFPWFMGFAIMGAGASSMCPMLMAIRWLGFK